MSAYLVPYEQIGEMASVLPTDEQRYFACRDLIQANIISLMTKYENHLNKDSVHNWNGIIEDWSGGFETYGDWLTAAVNVAESKTHSQHYHTDDYLIQQMGYVKNWRYQSDACDDYENTAGWKITKKINSICLGCLLEARALNIWGWEPEGVEIMD